MTTPQALVDALTGEGTLPDTWAEAVRAVPRALFLPDEIEVGGRRVDRSSDPARWLAAVYADVPVITQVNDGRPAPEGDYRLPTSSSSMPSVMLEMLELLDVHPGQRVLEAGTGTGYHAAWLCHRLGDRNVTSVDIDAGLVERAAKALAAAGYAPRLGAGDAAAGWPEGAPYDRLIATYTVPEIPYAWVEQAPGGRIVAPWGGSFFSHSYAVLDVADGRATGRFTGWPAFMRGRVARPHRGFLSDFHHRDDRGEPGRTDLDPRAFTTDPDGLFHTGLALPDAWYLLAEARDDSGEATLWLLADDRRSWATVEYVPGAGRYETEQFGPRRLWTEAETAYRRWQALGAPSRDRAGLTVDPAGQHLWLDTPDHPLPGPTP
ncbi:methyltransferase domain-containing protein [Streptomyces sp. LP05-1]|uniref:Protein-L-isoaspartate O-methyltransferase n=1 Tax=Streptomyces pyxinae TaxID=2970734 RepID=A0ABT2CQP1_9ACTN|nr:methyltransferase domain-containing protein [Streptomyces sp. LP05-1]MCS0639001.1 methyltransferase domain-containing protein [Streptomyces sp. LP05-1]